MLLVLVACTSCQYPPTDPDAWSRSPSNPVLKPTQPWEGACVCENVATFSNGSWKMWYRGGWGTTGVGLATSSDGINWTKFPGNPVYGMGGSGMGKDDGGQPWIIQVNSTFYLYTTNNQVPRVNVATSTDGISWVTRPSQIALPSGCNLWGNRVVWYNTSSIWP